MLRRSPFLIPAFILILLILVSSCSAPVPPPTASHSPAATALPGAVEAPAATEAPSPVEGESPSQTVASPSLAETSESPGDLSPAPLETIAPIPTGQALQVSPTPEQAGYPESSIGPEETQITPGATMTPVSTAASPQHTSEAQSVHQIHLEWPGEMRLGDSDTIGLTIVPSTLGFLVVAEYPEHQVVTQTVVIQRPSGYELFAVARLDGPGFDYSPRGEQVQYIPGNSALSWKWAVTPKRSGNQRMAIALALRWLPLDGNAGITREATIFAKSLDIKVHALFGLTQAEAMLLGILSLLLGSGIGAVGLAAGPTRNSGRYQYRSPNNRLVIETRAEINLPAQIQVLLQSLFSNYGRVIIEHEFLSGYSGARTLLTLPLHPDGRADAYTIAKIGDRGAIEREYRNYETYVKNTLPPITARIQHPPVVAHRAPPSGLAALQYTFIGEPGKSPVSLRQSLLDNPDPELLRRLMDVFGPNWWLQRRPFVFHAGQEYDRLLPSHFIVAPEHDRGTTTPLDGRANPSQLDLRPGDQVLLRSFPVRELRQDHRSLSLQGPSTPGVPPLRIRWLSTANPEGQVGRIIATRQTILNKLVDGCELFDLPNPIKALPDLLQATISGCASTIHGDLNLENLLIGPGRLIWLIDFASTRSGHAVMDFSHLSAEIIAHLIAPQIPTAEEYLRLIISPSDSPHSHLFTLLKTVEELAGYCLFNPADPSEYDLSLILTCLGALKYTNLDRHARNLLLVTAAQRLLRRNPASVRSEGQSAV